jgi:hypothetical protein
MTMASPNGRITLGMDPYYGSFGPVDRPEEQLWLPPGLRKQRYRQYGDKTGILVPEVAHTRKVIYFKGRLYVKDPSRAPSDIDYRWYGDLLRCHYNEDIDQPGADDLSIRDQIHIWITGKLERVSGGRWVYQNSDERWSTTVIEEWPLFQHSDTHWRRFLRRES